MVRLTGSERAVAEVTAVAEHVASPTAAAAFQLSPDVPGEVADKSASTVQLLDEATAPDAATPLTEIRAWAREALDIHHVPAVWRALAHPPRLLEATWRKNRLILGAGALDELVKGCAALAVAQFRQSPYWIAYLTHLLRTRSGLEDRALVELAGALMHYVSFTAELGVDMRQFPSDQHLASWAGLCPGTHESAGKHRSVKTRQGNNWLWAAFVEAPPPRGIFGAACSHRASLRLCLETLQHRFYSPVEGLGGYFVSLFTHNPG